MVWSGILPSSRHACYGDFGLKRLFVYPSPDLMHDPCPVCYKPESLWLVSRDEDMDVMYRWYYECKWCGEEFWNTVMDTPMNNLRRLE